MLYVFTKLNKKRDTANMKTRLSEKYFSIVITMWYKTSNRSTVSLYPSNATNIQIVGTWNFEYSNYSLCILQISGIKPYSGPSIKIQPA